MVTLSPSKVEQAAHPERHSNEPIQFIDLKTQLSLIRGNVDLAIKRVLDHGQYIMGPEVGELERQLAAFSGARHAISCSSGTDALLMVLMALGVGKGDAVICPAFTYTATPEVVALLGATPVLAEVDEGSFNLDPGRLPDAITKARQLGLKPRVLMPVDLFGQPADYDRLLAVAEQNEMFVLCDAAQSYGASYRGRRVGQLGNATGTSFFPAKPLGCYGDGGAVFTDDDALASLMRSIRAHGKGDNKYDIARVGINGRLDTVQAAVLIEKLRIFPSEITAREQVASRYHDHLHNVVAVPRLADGISSVWAQYTLRIPDGKRDAIASSLEAAGIPTGIYYPRPLHHQPAYSECPIAVHGVDVATRLCGEVLSLPMHPYLDVATQGRIIDAVVASLRD
jgi:dTDP-4-amino-4,6-dideoxygalactose transaminase